MIALLWMSPAVLALQTVPPSAIPTLPAPADPVLRRLLTEAESGSLDLGPLQARLARARISAEAAGVEGLPQTDGLMERSRQKASGSLATTLRMGLEATWELDLWGRLAHVRAAAGREAQACAEDLRAARLVLTSDVVATYQALRGAEAAQSLHETRVRCASGALERHRLRQQAGVAPSSDLYRAEQELRQVASDHLQVRREALRLRHRLALLLGRPDASLQDLAPAPFQDLPGLPPGLSAPVLEGRPDLAASAHRLAGAQARVGEARAARLPRFTLTGAAGFASAELKDLARSGAATWSLTPRLSAPIFDGGRGRLRVEAARAEALEAEAAHRQLQHRVLLETAEGFALVEEDSQALAHWQASAASAARSLAVRRAEREAGRCGDLPLLEAELHTLAQDLQVLQARLSLAQAQVALRRSMGLGW